MDVVGPIGYPTDIVTGPEPKKVGLLPMLTLRVSRLIGLSKITFFSPEFLNASWSILVNLEPASNITEVKAVVFWNV
jgi:hypothetical protein